MRTLADLTEHEILALAIFSREEDIRVYMDLDKQLDASSPDLAHLCGDSAEEMKAQYDRLRILASDRFGPHLPLVQRQDLSGWVKRPSNWDLLARGSEAIRRHVQQSQQDAARFFRRAAAHSTDPATGKLFAEFAASALLRGHQARQLILSPATAKLAVASPPAWRMLARQVIQPGLARWMDGAICTLAPVFAAAFATGSPATAFLVGLAASLGVGLALGCSTMLADDQGQAADAPKWLRGLACGALAAAGGLGHTLPFLVPHIGTATGLAIGVVTAELLAIAWVQGRYLDLPPLSAAAKIMLAGAVILATGLIVGRV